MTEPLTEREVKLLETVQWLADSVHEAHHMVTTDAQGNRIKVPDEHRRRRDACGSHICQYATQVLESARTATKTEDA